ncbi:Ubiquitin thioesterase Zranb1 [Characodon lateralis]|uniref:ubiquitinyl hydrolase 1 n=1 Tax=Characodon lateralis TaxID=208331 RepID=A0ABU7DTC3_9TELE|nr:Ubiquitin thioesterase Zranb1 [Characodon lateralis]
MLLQNDLVRGQLQSSVSQRKPYNSALIQRITSSVLALCGLGSIHPQTHAAALSYSVYSAPLTKCHEGNGTAKSIPLLRVITVEFMLLSAYCTITKQLSLKHVFFLCFADIEDLPPAVQEKLFDDVLDRDVQKELEEESPVINWCLELGTRLDSRLYALWNRTAGDCLLDSVLQATWGIYDKDSVLRKTLHDSLHDCSHWFYSRWKEWESWYSQSFGLHFSLREEQWQEDWAFILSLASQPGASLEQTHIFVLAHILRRPIIVYGVKYYKSFRGETLGYTRFQGVYLPLLWEQSFCWKSPIALGYTRGHFSALVAMENDGYDNRGAGANLNTDDDVTVTFLPLVDSERKLLHIHFLSAQEMGNEEQQEKLLREWLDCCVTDGGLLVAMQKSSRRRNHPLVTQMVEKWLDRYRQIRPCTSLSDGEEDDDEDE